MEAPKRQRRLKRNLSSPKKETKTDKARIVLESGVVERGVHVSRDTTSSQNEKFIAQTSDIQEKFYPVAADPSKEKSEEKTPIDMTTEKDLESLALESYIQNESRKGFNVTNHLYHSPSDLRYRCVECKGVFGDDTRNTCYFHPEALRYYPHGARSPKWACCKQGHQEPGCKKRVHIDCRMPGVRGLVEKRLSDLTDAQEKAKQIPYESCEICGIDSHIVNEISPKPFRCTKCKDSARPRRNLLSGSYHQSKLSILPMWSNYYRDSNFKDNHGYYSDTVGDSNSDDEKRQGVPSECLWCLAPYQYDPNDDCQEDDPDGKGVDFCPDCCEQFYHECPSCECFYFTTMDDPEVCTNCEIKDEGDDATCRRCKKEFIVGEDTYESNDWMRNYEAVCHSCREDERAKAEARKKERAEAKARKEQKREAKETKRDLGKEMAKETVTKTGAGKGNVPEVNGV